MLKPLQKVAIIFAIVGFEKGKSIIELMDSDEIKAVVPEIRKLIEISPIVKQNVWAEFEQLGYEDNMGPSEMLGIIRLLFGGSKISEKVRRRF